MKWKGVIEWEQNRENKGANISNSIQRRKIKYIKAMQKNKTHRIISISPTSQNSSLKGTHNKTTTPIKPIQHPTRTNTIRTTVKPDDVEISSLAHTNEKNNVVQSVFVSSYNDRDEPRDSKTRRDSFKIDEILTRIGKTYEGERGTASTELIKKTQIGYLREFIRQAKTMVKIREENEENSFALSQSSNAQIQNISSSIRSQISTFFSNLHKELYAKQKGIYEELEQKIFELKQKNITKCYQIATLRNYIEKCEADINNNYQGIINDIELKQLNQIVNSYTKRIEFYTEKVKSNETLRVNLPVSYDLVKNMPEISITLQKEEQPPLTRQTVEPQPVEIESRSSLNKLQSLGINLGQTSKLSFDKRLNIKCALEQVQNFPMGKLAKKKVNTTNENEPRIASARGKY